MRVVETFFSVTVADMQRASQFYAETFDARVLYASPVWSSLEIAGVRVGLNKVPDGVPTKVGLHFVVDDLVAACERVERAGGRLFGPPTEVQPGVVLADVADSEGNILTLSLAGD